MLDHKADNARTDAILRASMVLYNYLLKDQQAVICDFVSNFYAGKNVYINQDIEDRNALCTVTAANAALVGAAQNTDYFSCVKWIYFCADDLSVDGDAFMTSTVRLNADKCKSESARIYPGRNLVVHEFAHILDRLLGISGSTKGLRTGYNQYLNDIQRGSDTPIEDCLTPMDLSGASLPEETAVEFFAYASESFFTNAVQLQSAYGELYADLASIYGLDMAKLFSGH